MTGQDTDLSHLPRWRARRLLAAFLVTFLLSRIMVLLIMTHRAPDFYLHVGGTHVHHLNYGIVLLSAVGTWALLWPLAGRALRIALALFGVGLGLTFDEFGMWVHLGGAYWQRASFDAIVVVGGAIAWFAYGPAIKRYRPAQWAWVATMLALSVVFGYLIIDSLNHLGTRLAPTFQRIEAEQPS